MYAWLIQLEMAMDCHEEICLCAGNTVDPLPTKYLCTLQITGTGHEVALQVIGIVGVSISVVCMVITIVALLALK